MNGGTRSDEPRGVVADLTTRIVVPVKRLSEAKRRLAAELSPNERSELMLAMLRDVLSALAGAGRLAQTIVATGDELAARIARDAGAEVRPDPESTHSGIAALVARDLAGEGCGAVAFLAADLPLVVPEDLRALDLLGGDPSAVVVAPDRHGDGTNFLALAPPDLGAPSYGPGSLARHLALAARAGARAHVVRSPGLAIDVDTPEDLAEVARRCESAAMGVAGSTRAWLARHARATVAARRS